MTAHNKKTEIIADAIEACIKFKKSIFNVGYRNYSVGNVTPENRAKQDEYFRFISYTAEIHGLKESTLIRLLP